MLLLDRYILIRTVKIFFILLFLFTWIIALTGIFEKLEKFINMKLPLQQIVFYFLYRLPYNFLMITPWALFVSILLNLGLLRYNKELLSIISSGISHLRLCRYIIILAVIITFVWLYIAEYIAPQASIKAYTIEHKNFLYSTSELYLRIKDNIFLCLTITTDGKINNLYAVKKTKDKLFLEWELYSGNIIYDKKNKRWIGHDVIIRKFKENELIYEQRLRKIFLNFFNYSLAQINKLSKFDSIKIEMLTLKDLIEYVRLFDKSQQMNNLKKAKTDLYLKLSFAFLNITVALWGIYLGSIRRSKRQISLSEDFSCGIIISFACWQSICIGRALGYAGYLPPFISCSFANIIFFTAAVLLLLFKK